MVSQTDRMAHGQSDVLAHILKAGCRGGSEGDLDIHALMARLRTEPPVAETVGQCPHCLSEIPVAATVCAFCTRDVAVSGV